MKKEILGKLRKKLGTQTNIAKALNRRRQEFNRRCKSDDKQLLTYEQMIEISSKTGIGLNELLQDKEYLFCLHITQLITDFIAKKGCGSIAKPISEIKSELPTDISQVNRIIKSIGFTDNMLVDPVIVNGSNMELICGHNRLHAYRQMGNLSIPARIIHLDAKPQDIKKLRETKKPHIQQEYDKTKDAFLTLIDKGIIN